MRAMIPVVAVLFAVSLLVPRTHAQTKTAILELQASSNGLGNWQTQYYRGSQRLLPNANHFGCTACNQ